MAGSIIEAKFLSWDAADEVIDFPSAQLEVGAMPRGVVLSIWSEELEEGVGCTNEIRLTLSVDQARWLADRLDDATVSVRERPPRTRSLH